MRETILLTKTFLKNGFRSGDKGKTKIGLYIFICLYFSIFTLYISHEAMKVLHDALLEELFVQAIILFDIILICMQSVVSSLNMFYFSDDIEYVLPLPIKYKNLYQSKLNVLIVSEYIFEVLFFLAPLIYFGIFMNMGILYYIKMIILLISIPAVICSLIAFFTIRFVGLFKNLKNKDRVQYMGMIFALIIVMFVSSLSFGESGQGLTTTEILDMVLNLNESLNYKETILNKFINVFAMFLVSNETSIVISNLIKIMVIVFLFYRGITLINYKTYKRNISINFNNGDTSKIGISKRINKKSDTGSINIKKTSTLKSYVKKEFKMLVRTPMFFMQCILPTVVLPIVLCMPFAMNINNLETLDMPPLEELKLLAMTKEGISVIIIIIQFLYLMNVTQVTAVSRDNKNSIFMKHIPVSLEKQCTYKLIPGIILNIIPTIYAVLVLLFVLDFTIFDTLAVFITLLIINILESYMLILVDLKRPKINWDSETTVVKQNMNILIGYFIQIIMCVIIIFAIVMIENTILNSLFIVNIGMILACLLVKQYIRKNEVKLFSKIY